MARKHSYKFGNLYKHSISETLDGKQEKEEQCAFKSLLVCSLEANGEFFADKYIFQVSFRWFHGL